MQAINDVLKSILERRNTKIVGHGKCEGCGKEVQYAETTPPGSDHTVTAAIGCVCHHKQIEREESEKYAQAQKMKELKKLERYSFIPEEICNARIDTYIPRDPSQKEALEMCKQYIQEFPDNQKKNIVFSGFYGVGKSHLLYSIAHELATQRYSALFITMSDLVDAVMDTWNRGSEITQTQIVDMMVKADFLVIDELGMNQDSQRAEELAQKLLYKIANARIGKHTAYSTNLSSAELKRKLDTRTFDRVISTQYAHLLKVAGPSGRQGAGNLPF